MRLFFFLWATQVFAAFNLTWGTPALSLDSNPPIGDTDSNAYVAMDAEGNAVATWSRTTDGKASEKIWAAVYNHSLRTWTGAVKISGTGSAANSQTAVDPEGNAIFVWEEGFPTRIHYRILSKEGVWTPDLSKPPASVRASKNAQTSPQIVIDGSGNALTIWTEFVDKMDHLFSAYKPNGGSWTYLGEIASGLQNVHLIPSKALVINEIGTGAAVWEESEKEIHLARFVDGAWLPSFLIADGFAKSPSIGIDEMGDIVIVWSQNHAILSKTIQQGVVSELAQTISHPDYIAERPSVGIDASGNATVVFERYNLMHKFIAGANLPKGSLAWSQQIDLSGPSPADAQAAGYPVFVMNPLGDGVAIWKEWTGKNMVIQGAGYSLGTWSSIKTLSSVSGDAANQTPTYDISVALNHAGHILAIWPEDPLKTGSQQIKVTASSNVQAPSDKIRAITGVGLANTGPMPPVIVPSSVMEGIVSGKQVLHKFPAHSDLINILSWDTPGNVSHFNVYRENLLTFVGRTKEPRYEDHQRIAKEQVTYLITSVDHFGQESSPITFVVKPL